MAQPVDQVRLLITDVPDDPSDELLTDDQLQMFLDIEGQVVKLAAAAALEAISTSEVLVSKKIRTQDLQTDGPAVAAELRARAAQLRKQADDDDNDAWGGFDLAPTRTGRQCPPEATGRVVTWDDPRAVWGL